MSIHYPVDRCTTLYMAQGFLCNCGRTIIGTYAVNAHFGKSYEEIERELEERKEAEA